MVDRILSIRRWNLSIRRWFFKYMVDKIRYFKQWQIGFWSLSVFCRQDQVVLSYMVDNILFQQLLMVDVVMGNELYLTGFWFWFNSKNRQLLVDDGLKTCFNPSNYKRTKSFGLSMFQALIKQYNRSEYLFNPFFNTTHNNSKKEVKNNIQFLIFTPIIIICLIDYIYFIIVELLSIFHMTMPNNSSDMK